jgi:hypothetical protein
MMAITGIKSTSESEESEESGSGDLTLYFFF